MLSVGQHQITQLKGVGSKLAEKLKRLDIFTIEDLILHLPKRYQDRTQITPLHLLEAGQHATCDGEIRSYKVLQSRRPMLTVQLDDGYGTVTLRFFYFSPQQYQSLKVGLRVRAFAEVKLGHQGLEMIHPEYHIYTDQQPSLDEHLTPIYATTEGLGQVILRKLIHQALAWFKMHPLPELLPPKVLPCVFSLQDAIKFMHHPPAKTSILELEERAHPAQQRLIMEELLAHSLSLRKLSEKSEQYTAVALQETLASKNILQQFLKQLPFEMTSAQHRVCQEIAEDIARPQPMMRLVQGDVGSGKTLVAAYAALRALSLNYQVAFLAPTELLAEQHYHNFEQWLKPLGYHSVWLAGKVKGKARKTTLDAISSGKAHMIIGTHAIFQDAVTYQNLALVIIDEQHRFGVHQRMALKEKGASQKTYPHQLIMTATPIPRTLAMTAYANLETSIIDTLPPGRTPITTVALSDARRPDILERIHHAVQQDHRQVYWVCTLIETSDALSCQAAEATAQMLKEEAPTLRIGLIHGRMTSQEKQETMQSFKNKSIDLLVATTVIEVGVDVPNASLMIIENPERLGLAQLHQLRGRVGRGSIASHCVLLYQSPLSHTAKERLDILRQSNDGFVIAQKDLEIRGPGEVFGIKQAGVLNMKVADLVQDHHLIDDIKKIAEELTEKHPQQIGLLIDRWLGHREIYKEI